jgi:hypothetical protein
MKQKTLLLLVAAASITSVYAQKKEQKITAYAITAPQKGQTGWSEVRLVDITTGQEVQSIYQTAQEIELLNARTGKAILKKDFSNAVHQETAPTLVQVIKKDPAGNIVSIEKRMVSTTLSPVQIDKPFATNSAACAYDKKHERLYYTPMGINQLRYIDLKSNTSKIYYFEDEVFGAVKNLRDVANQITRMVFGSDGNGYALSNDGNHLIQFTTGKKPTITDLGALTDDAANGSASVHSQNGYGGDMIADAQKNLYLITANRNVFKISLETKVATFQGQIKGLPRGYSTNGAIVEGGSTVIVSSSSSTEGYYKFDLVTLASEKISNGGPVFNASDLANGVLAFDKKKKHREEPEEVKPEDRIVQTGRQQPAADLVADVRENQIAVYPNPVTNGVFRLSFANQPSGRYQVQLMDISGKVISSQDLTINNKLQVEEFKVPDAVAKGNYLVKVTSEANKISVINKLMVQ